MLEQIELTTDILSKLTPELMIGALILAVTLSAATAGTFRWLGRRQPNGSTSLICLVFAANLASMFVAVGVVQSKLPTVRMISRDARAGRSRVVYMYDHFEQPQAPAAVRTIEQPDPPEERPNTRTTPAEDPRSAESS